LIACTYNTQGLLDTITTYNEANYGYVVNQIQRDYNGLGQMTKEYQQHGRAVTPGTASSASLAVTYTYNTADLDKYGSRLTSITYPSGKVLSYRYNTGTANTLNDLIGRLDNLAESGTITLESYKYLRVTTNRIAENRTHNSANQVTNIASATLVYDDNGNLTTDEADLDGTGVLADAQLAMDLMTVDINNWPRLRVKRNLAAIACREPRVCLPMDAETYA
jgi:hypothetical protein